MSIDPTESPETFKKWLLSHLRRVSSRWPPKYKTQQKARVCRGVYKCAKCKKQFNRHQISLDHKIPVIDPSKGLMNMTWDEIIERLFVNEDGYQVLCESTCHVKKSNVENRKRMIRIRKEENEFK